MRGLVIIRGLPGAGKSYLAAELARIPAMQGIVVESDSFFEQPAGGYKYNQKLLGAAHAYAYGSVAKLLYNNHPGVVYVPEIMCEVRDIEKYEALVRRINESLPAADRIELRVLRVQGDFKSARGVPRAVREKLSKRFEDYPRESIVDDANLLVKTLWRQSDSASVQDFAEKVS